MVVRMVLHIVKFFNGFPQKGGVKHFSPGEIVTGRRLHADDLCLGFGIYCQVAENVEPHNSLAPCTRGAISLGSFGNLSGGQVFLALDTSMKGKKYAVAMTQIATSLGTSKNTTALAQMSVKLLPKGQHRRADFVGMIMAQLSMKTAIKKWGEQAKFAISKDSYKPCNLHSLSKKQKEQILGSHIFVEQKRDGTIKAHKVIGGNRQRDYITKKDVSSPTVTAEAVMLTCVIDAQEGCDVAVVDIPNAFVQTVVSEDA
jgi:hypothetical protein